MKILLIRQTKITSFHYQFQTIWDQVSKEK